MNSAAQLLRALARELKLHLLDLLPSPARNGGDSDRKEIPGGLVLTARLAGLIYGTLQFEALFAGLIVVQLAADLARGSRGAVIEAMTRAPLAGAIVVAYMLLRGAKLAPRWRVGGQVVVLGLLLVGLAARPSLAMLSVVLILAGALGSTAMLVRHELVSQFEADKGRFLAVAEKWTFATLSIAGLLFGLAGFGPLDWRWATAALGAWTVVVGIFQMLWRRLPALGRAGAASARDSADRAAAPPFGRLVLSPTLRQALLASIGIFAAVQLLLSHVQPRVVDLGFPEWASVIVALFGLAKLASLPWVHKYGVLSDEDAKRAATEASRLILLAALVGIVALCAGGWAGLVVLAIFVGTLEIGANSTRTAITTAITGYGARAILLAALARNAGAALGGTIAERLASLDWSAAGRLLSLDGAVAAAPSWTAGSAAILLFAAVVVWAVRRWERHATPLRIHSDGKSASLELTLEELDPGEVSGEHPAQFALRFRAGGVEERWKIWRRDSLEAKGPMDPARPRLDWIRIFEVRFDWPTAPREPLAGGGPLFPGAHVPLVLRGERRGRLIWRAFGGTWRLRGTTLVIESEYLGCRTEYVLYRHGAE